MQFNSYIFIFLFMPVTVIGYLLLSRLRMAAGTIFLILASCGFYIYGGLNIAAIFGSGIVVNYIFALILSRARKGRKAVLSLAVVLNVLMLLYFKYFNFFMSAVNSIIGRDYNARNILLPLGISFFTFQQIMYLVYIYRGNALDPLDYLAFVLYFPKLIMGPLAEPADFLGQLKDPALRKVNWDNIASGLKIFSFGLFKKLLLADTFSRAVAWGFGHTDIMTSMDVILVTLFYTFEIYFDFSGYCDMAVGVSQMINITLPMNFNSPYKAFSIRDFWKRWHMSLTGFFTRYVYIPLGGSKKGLLMTCINTMIVFLVSGIWHGANWTFILWGVLHGAFSIIDRLLGKREEKIFAPLRWFATFAIVALLWLLFRADSIGQWKDLLVRIAGFEKMGVSNGLLSTFILPETSFIFNMLHLDHLNDCIRGLPALLTSAGAFLICLLPDNNYNRLESRNAVNMILAAGAFIWSILCLSSESVFVYFNF